MRRSCRRRRRADVAARELGGAGGDDERQEPEDEGEGGHHHRAEAQPRALGRRLAKAYALSPLLLGELDDQMPFLAASPISTTMRFGRRGRG